MSILEKIDSYLEAKTEYEEASSGGNYSQTVERLHCRMTKAAFAFESALEDLIADRIKAATGAKP